MNLKKNIIFIVIVVFSSISCGKKSTPNPTKTTRTVVYVTGNHIRPGNIPVAVYWKNGVEIALTDSSGSTLSVATGIAISDTDVYIAGALNFVATYWKNGKAVSLPGFGAYADAITVSGTDVYVAGYSGGNPAYWKNGVLVALPVGAFGSAYADGIAVVGSDVYVVGNSLDEVLYWKNGVLKAIANSPSGYATYYANTFYDGWVNIGVSGSDVYITGAAPGHLTSEYWKNGVATYLVNDPAASSVLNNIAINGTDVYAAGYYGLSAAYWKNGTLNRLPGSTQSSYAMATAIAVNGNDVYVAGSAFEPYSNAVYWKNGTLIPLSNSNTVTTGIGVVQY